MKILQLNAENVKKLKAVQITPNDSMVVISGKNGQGKTSVLDSIVFALGGKDAQKLTVRPIREGEKEASVELDLGDYRVRRTWTGNDKSYLSVEGKAGEKFPSPQSLLDSLIGELSFDPLEFARMDAKRQRETLLGIVDVGIDLAAWQKSNDDLFEKRTVVGREEKQLEGQLAGLPEVQAPDEEVDVAALMKEIEAAERSNAAIRANILEEHRARKEVERLQQALRDAEETLRKAEVAVAATGTTVVDTEPLKSKVRASQQTNAQVRQKKDRQRVVALLATARGKYGELTQQLETGRKEKAEALAKAKMPIDGLGLDDDGVTFRGIPFAQLSSAEQLKVSLALAMAKNPRLRVIRILDGSLLDDDNMAVIREMATEQDFQVWIEKVDGSGKVGVYIEEGEVASAN